MRNRKSINIAASIVTVAALAVISADWVRLPPRPDRSVHNAIGAQLGRQAVALLRPGGKVTLITRDTETFPQPALDVLRTSFERELSKAQLTTIEMRLVQTDPLRPVDVPPGDFFDALRAAKAGDVVVSLLGPPLLTEEQRARLGTVAPKVIAFCPGPVGENVDLERLANAGLVHAAVVSRKVNAATTAGDLGFQDLYVATNFVTLAQRSASSP